MISKLFTLAFGVFLAVTGVQAAAGQLQKVGADLLDYSALNTHRVYITNSDLKRVSQPKQRRFLLLQAAECQDKSSHCGDSLLVSAS